MSKKIIVLDPTEHVHSTITSEVVAVLIASGKEPLIVGMGNIPEEKGARIPRLESIIISKNSVIKGISKGDQTNHRERRKNKRLK